MRNLLLATLALSTPAGLYAQAPAPGAPLSAEQEMEQIFSEAAKAFNEGKFDEALQKLAVIHEKTGNKDFEKVMFLEGACYFNLTQYDKAIELLNKFVSTYPTSEIFSEAKMSLGRAYLKKGDEANGVKILKEVAGAYPAMLNTAGLEIAYYYKGQNKSDQALDILQVILKGINGPASVDQQQAIIMASEIHVAKGETDKAAELTDKLRSGGSADQNAVQLNNLGVKVGDAMLEQKRYGEALKAYQTVRRQSEVVRLQRNRINVIDGWVKRLEANQTVPFMGRFLSKEEAASMLEANRTILSELEAAKDYDASIYYRLGQCFYEMQRYYESILAFQKIYDDFKDFPERHRCLFGMIVGNAALKRNSRAVELSEKYLEQFPEGPNYPQVTDMMGALLYESGNITKAVDVFKRAMSAPGADKERIGFMLGCVLFEAQQFSDARLAFKELLTEFKTTEFKDDAQYRVALSYFFENDSDNTRKNLREYIASNPKGNYVVDAKYRLEFINFQAIRSGQPGGGKIGDVIENLNAIASDYPNDQNLGQVYSLLGDIYSEMQPDPDGKINYVTLAMESYRKSVDHAKSEDVLNYSIEAATNLMVDQNMWAEVSSMWDAYYKSHEGKPEALKAIYWISRSKERETRALETEKKFEEAAAKSREARELVAKAIVPHFGNPSNDQVEVLLQQLVTMIVPKRRPRASSSAATASATTTASDVAAKPADGSAAPATTPAPAPEGPKVMTPDEMEEELKRLLTPDGDANIANGTAAARLLYGRALIARYMRDVTKFENYISIIPDAAKAEELPALLLATLGDMLNKKGDKDKATEYYQTLLKKFPTSEFADKAPVGLGQIEFEKKDFEKALEYFNEGLSEKYIGTTGMMEATLGKAKTLYQLGTSKSDKDKIKEADELYQTIFATKEWRGEPHAVALFMQGEIAKSRGEDEKALSFYQRTFLSQGRFKEWAGKAYLEAAKCLIKLNRQADASKLLREALAAKGIPEQPVFPELQKLLGQVGN